VGKRLIVQRRGRGSIYRSPSHRHIGDIVHPKLREGRGRVVDILHDPGHTAPVAIVDYGKMKVKMLAAEGMHIDQEVQIGTAVHLAPGNTMPIGRIPEGTQIYNIEAKPGDGGKFARSGGSYGVVVGHGRKTIVRLPSEKLKALSPDCMATIGVVAGGGRGEKPFAKAGKKIHAYRSRSKRPYKVRGIAMNPVNHPHGGGSHQHVGRPSTVSTWAPPGRKVGRLSPKKRRK